jgi:hypothetical protein
MGSIGSTLNSIKSSLLSEISSFNATQSKKSSGLSTTPPTSSSDNIDFSQVASLFKQLRQLQQSNPTEFKQVLNDASSKLTVAAAQTTDPQQAAFLKDLAGKFQTASSTGDLSALTPNAGSTSAVGGASPYAAQGHHHRSHAGGGSNLLSSILASPPGQSSTSPTSQIQNLLSGVVGS